MRTPGVAGYPVWCFACPNTCVSPSIFIKIVTCPVLPTNEASSLL